MANTTAVLRGYLQSALRDSSNETWTTTEMDNAIIRAVRTLAPRVVRPLDPESYTQVLTAADYFYAIDAAIIQITSVDWIDSDGNERGRLKPGTWETVGDILLGVGKIHITPYIADTGGTLRYHGYGRYDTTTNYIPDEYISLVIAKAEVELLHYMKSDRNRFLNWANSRQDQNVSVNELLQSINAAEQRARELEGRSFTWRKPSPAYA